MLVVMRRIDSLLVMMAGLACCTAMSVPASAQPARGGRVVLGQTSGSNEAQEHFETAKEHYANGRYREAISELETALSIDPSGADLVYNLGVIHEKLQEVDNAILYYQQYVHMIDDPEEKQRVSSIVERLEKARDELEAEKEAAEAEGEPSRDEGTKEKGRLDGWVIGAGIIAGLGLVGGTYFGMQALKNRNDDPPTTGGGVTYADLQDNADKAKQQALYADVGFGVALAAGTTAAILYFARDADSGSQETGGLAPGVALLPGGAAASFRVGF